MNVKPICRISCFCSTYKDLRSPVLTTREKLKKKKKNKKQWLFVSSSENRGHNENDFLQIWRGSKCRESELRSAFLEHSWLEAQAGKNLTGWLWGNAAGEGGLAGVRETWWGEAPWVRETWWGGAPWVRET